MLQGVMYELVRNLLLTVIIEYTFEAVTAKSKWHHFWAALQTHVTSMQCVDATCCYTCCM